MSVAIALFVAAYLLISGAPLPFLKLDRTSAALASATAMAIVTHMGKDTWTVVSWETISLLLGMMIITSVLVAAGLFQRLAYFTVRHARTPRRLLVGIVLSAGVLSALLVNDTVCVMLTPLIVAVVEQEELEALPFLLALASAANIGGVVSYTGNPQNMLVGTQSPIPFAGYLLRMLPVGALGLAADAALLLLMFRRSLPTTPFRLPHDEPPPPVDRFLLGVGFATLALVTLGFLLRFPLAPTALAGASLLLVIASASRHAPPREVLARVDLQLLLFFASLFIVVGGLARTGALEHVFAVAIPHLDGPPARTLPLLAAATIVGSNLFSNVPFVVVALPALPHLHDPRAAWLALPMAATFAGNLTPVGSVANLIVLELAGRHGKVGFLRFVAHGAVITVVTVALGLAVLLAERALGLL